MSQKREQTLYLSPDFYRTVPDGDDRERKVCRSCGHIDYENPKIVAGLVARHEGRILLCRRAITPRRGYWTLPAGFMELGETTDEAARREAWEEAFAKVQVKDLLSVYSVPRIGQVHIFYLADLVDAEVSAGPESAEVGLFAMDDLPWAGLAFPTVHWALTHSLRVAAGDAQPPFTTPPEDAPLALSGLSSQTGGV
jgi:ADP-ribose pyrophosphatase YjhB (NUDIX family)